MLLAVLYTTYTLQPIKRLICTLSLLYPPYIIYTEEAAKLTNKKDGVDGEEGGDKNKDTKDNKKEDNFKFRKETVEDEEVKIHPDTCKY